VPDKVRGSTLQQKFGFQDKDLTTEGHDEIMIWLNDHCQEILSKLYHWRDNAQDLARQMDPPAPIPDYPGVQILSIEWEHAIKSGTWLVGFIDMAVRYKLPFLYIDKKDSGEYVGLKVGWTDSSLAFFEVKTSIPSLGELVRQIRMYQSYPGYSGERYFVVSPDNTWAEQLWALKIWFIYAQDFAIPF
jgi:hypothetical protein